MESTKKVNKLKLYIESLRRCYTSYYGEEVERIKKLKKRYKDEEIINLFEKDIIRENNPRLSLAFLDWVKGANLKEHFKVVLASDNANLIYLLCRKYKHLAELNGLPDEYVYCPKFKEFEDRILEIGNVKKCIDFALEFDNTDWEAHKDIIVKNGSLEDLIIFMAKLYKQRKERHLDNIDFNRYMKMAIDNKCVEACCAYIIEGVEDEKMHNELIKTIIMYGDEFSVLWCQTVAHNWQAVGDIVASTDDPYKNLYYITAPVSQPGIDIKKNEKVVTDSGDLKLNYQLIDNAFDDMMPISNVNIQEHKDVIFKSKSLKGVYYKILYKTKVEPKEKRLVKNRGK